MEPVAHVEKRRFRVDIEKKEGSDPLHAKSKTKKHQNQSHQKTR